MGIIASNIESTNKKHNAFCSVCRVTWKTVIQISHCRKHSKFMQKFENGSLIIIITKKKKEERKSNCLFHVWACYRTATEL